MASIDECNKTGRLWPVRPGPQEDELCSSWVARLALTYGLEPREFCLAAFGTKPNVWPRDIDRGANRLVLDVLAEKTGLGIERVENTILSGYEGRISERISTQSNSAWILPIGSGPRPKGNWYGLQYCPKCLAEDDIPYFRREWRLAFITLCSKHSRQLLDRCGFCSAPINYRNSYPAGRRPSLTLCHACEKDHRDAECFPPAFNVGAKESEFQIYLLKVIRQGWIEIPGIGPIYSHLYFIVLRRLMVLLTWGKKGDEVRRYVSGQYGIENLLNPRHRYVAIEWLDVTTRRILLSMARELLIDWPDRFIECCKANKLSRQALFNHMDYIPYWYWNVVRWHLAVGRYESTEQEIESALRCLYHKGYDQFRNAQHLPENIRAVARFLNNISSRRKTKLWRKLGVANRRLQANRSSQRFLLDDKEKNIQPIPRMIPDGLWRKVECLIPTGRPYREITKGQSAIDDQTALSGIIYVLATNCAWKKVPAEFGTYNQVHWKYKLWKRAEGFQKVVALCLQIYRGR